MAKGLSIKMLLAWVSVHKTNKVAEHKVTAQFIVTVYARYPVHKKQSPGQSGRQMKFWGAVWSSGSGTRWEM